MQRGVTPAADLLDGLIAMTPPVATPGATWKEKANETDYNLDMFFIDSDEDRTHGRVHPDRDHTSLGRTNHL